MPSFHQYYYDHLVQIHDGLRSELKRCINTLSTVTQPTSVKSSLQNVIKFCHHLQGHHDLEEFAIFPAFAAVTDISHWSASHEELDSTLGNIRKLAQQGIDQGGKEFDTEKEKLIKELQSLSDIVLPHFLDEEVMSNPTESVKLWPTEKDMRGAFPWMY
ncbi:hypothetical protein BGZ46_000530 [Entomortierella lignicola]|nr:hypothetical protein BGZ46_000530 [Entomortierella lignicola]KAF9209694.1 hypothetical protein BGZ49_002125 [Haplosporangium sp. Z 27]